MTFNEVLSQTIAMLGQHGRVSYRALKRQFNIDDDYLEDLKYEIIDVQQLAVDQDDHVLVWTGDTETTPVITSQPGQTSEPLATASAPSRQVEAPPTPDAERRQLTVMFCDLADSTRLSGQLDPEDLRDVIRAYQATCAEVIERYDGYIAQHLGDGLMVYFGWPQAHEDDAQRAVHAGLGILEAMGELNSRLEQEKGIHLAVRIGIHTGLVVVGEIGKGVSQEHLALGATPNVAARVEGVAEPNTVAISDATYQLVQGYFVCGDLGQYILRGVDDVQQVHRVVRESDVKSRFDVAATRGLTPLVGRESETTLLLERWQQVKAGQGQVVLLSGEAGIGKSRLLHVLRDHVADELHARLECHSSPYYQNTALYPITDMFQRVLNWQQDDSPEAKLNTLEQMLRAYRLALDEAIPLFANLLSLTIPGDRYPPLDLSPQQQRQKTLAMIVAMLLQQAEQQPVLFILEDLHWTDPSTLELLDLLIDQTPTAAICLLLTYRPAFRPSWDSRSYLTQMPINRLSQNQIEQMAERVVGEKRLPDEVHQQIVARTDGIPLYIEEITKAIFESGHLEEIDGRYELTGNISTLAIPATLQDSLMARLDRLMTAKGIAQIGATIGRQFSYELLLTVSQADEVTLQQELKRLVEAELLYQRGLPPKSTYTFKHALIRDVAYSALMKSTRQQYHRKIAQILEEQFVEVAASQPELLARHYMEAGLNQQAIDYAYKAGKSDVERSAHKEAIRNLTSALELLKTFPPTSERARQELTIQRLLGVPLLATKGYAAPEVEQTYTRARELCDQVGDTSQLFPVLWGLALFHLVRAELPMACEIGRQLLNLGQRHQDQDILLGGYIALGMPLFQLGKLVSAQEHFEQAMTLYNAQKHHAYTSLYGLNPGVMCHSYGSWTLWFLGYPDLAVQRSQHALSLAREVSHPHSLVFALAFAARLHQCRRDEQAVYELTEAMIAISIEHELAYYLAQGMILQGWALSIQGRGEDGIDRMRQGLTALRATGTELGLLGFLLQLAEGYRKTGQVEEALAVIDESLRLMDRNGVRCWEAEQYRLKGELLLSLSPDHQYRAETYFSQSIEVAQRQQARSLELRAAFSLGESWQRRGKREEARQLLTKVFDWFSEGFDTPDLQEVKTLLAPFQ